MKLWVLTNEYAPFILGGLGVVATNLSRELAGGDMQVTVIAKTTSSQVHVFTTPYLKIIRFPVKSAYYSAVERKYKYEAILNWLHKHDNSRPELIHTHSVEYAGLAHYYKKRNHTPLVYTCHSLVALEGQSPVERLVANRQKRLMLVADQIVVPSQWALQQMGQLYPFSQNKICVIENGIRVQEQSKQSVDQRHLLFVGRLIPSKGIEELLHAVALILKKEPGIRLDVIGKGAAVYQHRLETMAHSLGVNSNVRWLGYYEPDKVQQSYSSYGAVVVPSYQESFGLVALEALAHGVPLISTSAGGLAQFVNKEVAEVISHVSSSEIAASIQRMWSEKKLTRKRVEQGLQTAKLYH